MKLLLFCAGVAVVSAKCANDCSGHGDCNAKNQCECHRNFFGADCSQRLCASGRAFVDSAIGDVNGDNTVGVDLVYAQGVAATPVSEKFSYQYGGARDSYDVTAGWSEAHFYQECSAKGVCDTTTGECACFPGYEGSGCARKSCENDCSGHGACKNYEGTAYNMWDADATLYCDCDAGYTGPGCEQRVCPAGVDPVQASNMDTSRFYQIGFKTLSANAGDFTTETFYSVPFGPVTWTITLTDEFGDEWTTSTLTTNYDVIHDATNAVPLYSMPIIAAGVEDAASAWTEDSDDITQLTIPTKFNTFGDGSLHVADQVSAALTALPDGASGSLTVHEIYTSPVVNGGDTYELLSNTYPTPFTGYDDTYRMAWPGICGRYDIYISADDIAADGAGVSAASPSIAGCGVAIVDSQLGSDACLDRMGNQDIDDFLGSTGAFDQQDFTGIVSDENLNVVFGINAAGTEEVVDVSAKTPNYIGLPNGGATEITSEGTFAIFTDGVEGDAVIYYQYPHFSNGDAADSRFPLFEDLVASCADPTSPGFYADVSVYHHDLLALSDGSIPGLSLFIYFTEATLETSPRVDYSFNNRAADAYAPIAVFNGEALGVGMGETIEGTSGGDGDYASHSLIEVASKGGDRVWDVAYHGRQAYFLEDQSVTSTGVMAHMCSKRGLCDYSTGLCDCFSGFTGANCAEQNALAY